MNRNRHLFEWLRDPILIVGTAISLVLGVVFYVRADIGTALGVLAGIIGITVTLQIQAIQQAERRTETATRSGALTAMIEGVPWLPTVIGRIAERCQSIDNSSAKALTVPLGQEILRDCQERLADLERGHFSVPYGDMRFFFRLTEGLQGQLLCTSAQEVDLDWWFTPRSQHYWGLQKAAISRGIKITRIFVYYDWSDKLHQLAEIHRLGGIEVMAVHRDRLEPHLRADIVIWDNQCTYETRTNASGEPTVNSFSMASAEVDRALNNFHRIRDNAVVFDGSPL